MINYIPIQSINYFVLVLFHIPVVGVHVVSSVALQARNRLAGVRLSSKLSAVPKTQARSPGHGSSHRSERNLLSLEFPRHSIDSDVVLLLLSFRRPLGRHCACVGSAAPPCPCSCRLAHVYGSILSMCVHLSYPLLPMTIKKSLFGTRVSILIYFTLIHFNTYTN